MARLALAAVRVERHVEVSRSDRRLEAAHLLVGVLDARVGTVPRALALAGVDRDGLTGRAEAALAQRG